MMVRKLKKNRGAMPGLRKKAQGKGEQWEPGKISEMIYDFAEPLLELGGGPQDIETLRKIMMMASVAWNVPLLEKKPGAGLAEHLHLFDELPEPLRSAIQGMRRDRAHHSARGRTGTPSP